MDTQHRDQLSSHPDPAAQFDYDFGPSNTQTRPGGGDAKSPDGSVEPGDDQDPDQLDHGKEDTIYYKAVTGTRARFPPEVKQGNGATVAPQSSTTSQSDSSTANGKKHKNSQSGVQYGCKTTLRQIMLDWGKGKKEGDDAQQNVLNATVQTGAGKVESQNSVVWQHSEVEDIELDELNNLSARLKATGLEESMIGLSKRLLKRVRLVTERDFVNGRFLTPTVMRYDMHDASRYGHGRSCMFVSFPYFDVSETRERGKFRKGDASHPIRTLLQSHYRLNETVDRDESQCIRTIGAPALKSCIQGGDTKRLCHKAHAELIYVPQMWALVIGLGHMLTAGPISDGALQTSELVINDRPRSDIHRCDFVRISFMNENMLEEVTYPREQCASWFALLNKHHEILHALPQKKKGANPKRFPLRIKEQMLSDDIWASVQRQSNEPVLELLMDTPKPPKMTITTFDSATSPKERQIGESEEFPKAQAMLMPSRAGADIERLGSVPVVRAFLAWRVMDEYGEINDCSVDVKTGRFLSTIYELLPARCVDGILDSGGRTTQYRPIPGFKGSPRPLLDIVGRTVDDVRAMGSIASSRETDITIQKKLFTEYEGLFGFFVPKEHDRGSAPVRLFWGSLYALLVSLALTLWCEVIDMLLGTRPPIS